MPVKMKYTLVFCVALFSIFSAKAQQIAIPDIQFETALINQGIDTGPLDGFISQVDAEAFTGILSISASGSGTMSTPIRDLTGIEAFVNITGLDASPTGAEIHTMDLSFNT
jgi:hypothetical protein